MTKGLVPLLLLLALLIAGCGGAQRPPSDEVTTRMNAADERALDSPRAHPDAGPPAG